MVVMFLRFAPIGSNVVGRSTADAAISGTVSVADEHGVWINGGTHRYYPWTSVLYLRPNP